MFLDSILLSQPESALRQIYCYPKIDKSVEIIFFFLLSIFGSWAIYYWVMVLCFGSSLTDLVSFSPLLLVQIILSFALLRTGVDSFSDRACPPNALADQIPGLSRTSVLTAALLIGAAVPLIWLGFYSEAENAPGYSILWSASLCVVYFILSKSSLRVSPQEPAEITLSPLEGRADYWVYFISMVVVSILAFGRSFPTPDDAYYFSTISYTLAHPESVVLGQDILLGTDTPYTLHPSYRLVGHEVLVAYLSTLTGLEPFDLNYSYLPAIYLVLWFLACRAFFRVMGVPFAGIAVSFCSLLLLFWAGYRAPMQGILNLSFGKNVLDILAAPLLYFAVGYFADRRNFSSWLVLFLSVCVLASLSTTALVVVPISLLIAVFVFFDLIKKNIVPALLSGMALLPIVIGTIYTLAVLYQYPISAGDMLSGKNLSQPSVWGGDLLRALQLVLYLTLPLMALCISGKALYGRLRKFCALGVLTLLSPYFVEGLVHFSGMNMLSWRLHWIFPRVQIVAIFMVLLMLSLLRWRDVFLQGSHRVKLVVGMSFISFFSLLFLSNKHYAFNNHRELAAAVYNNLYGEGAAVRAMLPSKAYVVTSKSNWAVSLHPNPPTFVALRHYLPAYKSSVSASEYAKRARLFSLITTRRGMEGASVQEAVAETLKLCRELGVSSLVISLDFQPGKPGWSNSIPQYVEKLTTNIVSVGYRCSDTPSGLNRVCNLVGLDA